MPFGTKRYMGKKKMDSSQPQSSFPKPQRLELPDWQLVALMAAAIRPFTPGDTSIKMAVELLEEVKKQVRGG